MSSSSERTRRKALEAMYNELATNVRNNHNVAPVKNDGYRYNSMGITRYDPAPTNSNQVGISSYSSYSQRMDIKLGKQFSNTSINGTEQVKYESKSGNLIRVTYNQGENNYNSPLVATGDLDSSGGKVMKNDFIPYGEIIDYPGFITDDGNSIFKTSGNGRCSEQCQTWVKNLTSIEHVGSDKWNRLNSNETMSGFLLTTPVLLWTAFDINITDSQRSDLSGYIFNGKHRRGILKDSFNPVLYFDEYDHINFTINVSGPNILAINSIDTSGTNNLITQDIQTNLGNNDIIPGQQDLSNNMKLHWNPKDKGIYYYNNINAHPVIGGKIVIGNIDGGSRNAYSSILPSSYPILTEIDDYTYNSTNFPSETRDTTPTYKFTSTKEGTININPGYYTIDTSSSDINSGGIDYTITFSTLSSGFYQNIGITITDDIGNVSNTLIIPDFRILLDITGPIITQITPIPTVTNSDTPTYVFNVTEAGTITVNQPGYDISFITNNTDGSIDVFGGNNTLTFTDIPEGTYSNISLYVTDVAANNSSTLTIPDFTIDRTAPNITNINHIPSDNNVVAPSFSFISSEVGTISISSVSYSTLDGNSATIDSPTITPQSIIAGINTITFAPLAMGQYDIRFEVEDSIGNGAKHSLNQFKVDTVAPVITQITQIEESTPNTSPEYIFNSTKNGTIVISPSKYTPTNSNVVKDVNNTIKFDNLIPKTYSNISFFVRDDAGNVSNTIIIPTFTVGALLKIEESIDSFTKNQSPTFTFSSSLDGSFNVYDAFFTPPNSASSIIKSVPYTNITNVDTSNIFHDVSTTIQFINPTEGLYKYIGITVKDICNNISSPLYIPNFTIDRTGAEISEVTPIPTTTNTNPPYVFNSNEIGTISISDASFTPDGGTVYTSQTLSVTPTDVKVGLNTINFGSLPLGKYSDISFKVIDRAGNDSNDISDISFEIVAQPQLTMITEIPDLSSNLTPSFTFNTGIAGTIDIGVVNTKAVFDASEAYHLANNVIVDINRTINEFVDIKNKISDTYDFITTQTSGRHSALINGLNDISYNSQPIHTIYSVLENKYIAIQNLTNDISENTDILNEYLSDTKLKRDNFLDNLTTLCDPSNNISDITVLEGLFNLLVNDINDKLDNGYVVTGQVGGGGYSSTTSRDLTGDEVDTFETIKNTSTEIMGIINNISTSTLWEIVEKKISDLKKLNLNNNNYASEFIRQFIYIDDTDTEINNITDLSTIYYRFVNDFSNNYPLESPVTTQNILDASTNVSTILSYVNEIADISNNWSANWYNITGDPRFKDQTDPYTLDNINYSGNKIIPRGDINVLKDISNRITEMLTNHSRIDYIRNDLLTRGNSLTLNENNVRAELVAKETEYSSDINKYNTAIANIIDPNIVTTPGNITVTFDTLLSDISYDLSFTLTAGSLVSEPLEIPDFSINAGIIITYGPAIPSPSSDSKPSYIFNSKTKSGTISRESDLSFNIYHITDTQRNNTIHDILADNSYELIFTTLPIGDYNDVSFTFTPTFPPGITAEIIIPSFTINSDFVGLSNTNPIPVTVRPYHNYNTGDVSKGYVFGGGEFLANKKYTLSTSSNAYRFTDIPFEHPMAILNNGNSAITVSPTDYIEITVSDGNQGVRNDNGEFYKFKYNDTEIHFGRGQGENVKLFRFMRGGNYRFKADNISGHPFKIFINGSQQGFAISNDDDTNQFTIPSNIDTTNPQNFRYQCGNHTAMTNTLPFTYKNVSGTTSDGAYDFYYGDVDVNVSGDFGIVSVYCYYHNYMGGQNLLIHS